MDRPQRALCVWWCACDERLAGFRRLTHGLTSCVASRACCPLERPGSAPPVAQSPVWHAPTSSPQVPRRPATAKSPAAAAPKKKQTAVRTVIARPSDDPVSPPPLHPLRPIWPPVHLPCSDAMRTGGPSCCGQRACWLGLAHQISADQANWRGGHPRWQVSNQSAEEYRRPKTRQAELDALEVHAERVTTEATRAHNEVRLRGSARPRTGPHRRRSLPPSQHGVPRALLLCCSPPSPPPPHPSPSAITDRSHQTQQDSSNTGALRPAV